MRLLIYFFLILIPYNALTQEMPSINEYKEHNGSNKYDGFVLGLENGLEWANDEFYRKYAKQLFCKPTDLILPVTEIKKLINEQIERDNSFFEKYQDAPLVGLAMKNAYVRNFPCSGK